LTGVIAAARTDDVETDGTAVPAVGTFLDTGAAAVTVAVAVPDPETGTDLEFASDFDAT
jgi:hypothetical protein